MAEQLEQTNKVVLYDVYVKIHGYGQIKLICSTDNLKETCEDYIKFYKKHNPLNAKITIDACNRNTAEVRRIWQNQNKTFLQFPTGQSPHME